MTGRRWTGLVLIVGMLLVFAAMGYAHADGPPAGYAGDQGTTCVECHNSYPLNSGAGVLNLDGYNEMTDYWPGDMNGVIDVELDDPTASCWGFQLTALDQAGEYVGTLHLVELSTTQFVDQAHYITQTEIGTHGWIEDGVEWQTKWRSSDAGNGDVTVFVTGVAADNDGTPAGDHVYATSYTISQVTAANYLTIKVYQNDEIDPSVDPYLPCTVLLQRTDMTTYQDVNLWYRATLPNGNLSPVFHLSTVNIGAFPGISWGRQFHLNTTLPTGNYLLHAYLGYFPNAVLTDSTPVQLLEPAPEVE